MCGVSVQRVLFCSGKHYYALQKQRETLPEACKNTALIRVEEICPFPTDALQQELHKYTNAKGERPSACISDKPTIYESRQRSMHMTHYILYDVERVSLSRLYDV